MVGSAPSPRLARTAAFALGCALALVPEGAGADADTATLAHPVALTKLTLPGFFGYTARPNAAATEKMRAYVARLAASPPAALGSVRVAVAANPERAALQRRAVATLRAALAGVEMVDVGTSPPGAVATPGEFATPGVPGEPAAPPVVSRVVVGTGADRALYVGDSVLVAGANLTSAGSGGTLVPATLRVDLGDCGQQDLAVTQADVAGHYLVARVPHPLAVTRPVTRVVITVETPGGVSTGTSLVYHAAMQTVTLTLPLQDPRIGDVGSAPDPLAGCANFAGDCYGTFTVGGEARLQNGYTLAGAAIVTLSPGASPCIDGCSSRAVIASAPSGATLRTKVEWYSAGTDPAWSLTLRLRGPQGARPLSTSDAAHDPCRR